MGNTVMKIDLDQFESAPEAREAIESILPKGTDRSVVEKALRESMLPIDLSKEGDILVSVLRGYSQYSWGLSFVFDEQDHLINVSVSRRVFAP